MPRGDATQTQHRGGTAGAAPPAGAMLSPGRRAAKMAAVDAPGEERRPRWGLALLVGLVMAVVVNLYVFASDYVIVSSRLTFAWKKPRLR